MLRCIEGEFVITNVNWKYGNENIRFVETQGIERPPNRTFRRLKPQVFRNRSTNSQVVVTLDESQD